MYTIKEISRLSGVSKRTLRYYDEIGLLVPSRVNTAGYRLYSSREVDILQEILLMRAMGFSLQAIKQSLQNKDYDRLSSFHQHLLQLEKEKERIEMMMENVHHTIQKEKGLLIMQDKDKFQGLKQKWIEENEAGYGEEIRARYGERQVEAANEKLLNMSRQDYQKMQEAEEGLKRLLPLAVEENDPASELGEKIYSLHKEWLMYHWKEYNPEAHKALGVMYVEDQRFKAYYDNIVEGGAEILMKILDCHCGEDGRCL